MAGDSIKCDTIKDIDEINGTNEIQIAVCSSIKQLKLYFTNLLTTIYRDIVFLFSPHQFILYSLFSVLYSQSSVLQSSSLLSSSDPSEGPKSIICANLKAMLAACCLLCSSDRPPFTAASRTFLGIYVYMYMLEKGGYQYNGYTLCQWYYRV